MANRPVFAAAPEAPFILSVELSSGHVFREHYTFKKDAIAAAVSHMGIDGVEMVVVRQNGRTIAKHRADGAV